MRRSISAYVDVDIADVLDQMDNAYLTEECEKRGIKLIDPGQSADGKTDARFEEARDQAEYEFDSLLHDLRAAFHARDHRHFDVLLSRVEGRYRNTLSAAVAREKVA